MTEALEVIDHETGEFVPVSGPVAPVNLFGTDNPDALIERASAHAKALDRVIRGRDLFKRIGDKDHILVEGWTLLGSMLGVFPVVVWTRELDDGWEARVEARTLAGAVVGAAESECRRSERMWKGRDDYALRSMAQTRATSKALRGPLGFIVHLAGFNPTPAEEMPSEGDHGTARDAGQGGADPSTASQSAQASAAPSEDILPPLGPNTGEPYIPTPPTITKPQKAKLNALVGKLRDAGHITTEQLYQAVGRPVWNGPDRKPHWGPLRDELSKEQASELIDKLERFEANVGRPKFEAPASVQAELS